MVIRGYLGVLISNWRYASISLHMNGITAVSGIIAINLLLLCIYSNALYIAMIPNALLRFLLLATGHIAFYWIVR